MSTSFRKISIEEVNAAHSAYICVFDWLNAKGVRQWLCPLSKEIFVERQCHEQLFVLYIDDQVAAVVTLAFEESSYWLETIGLESRWWVKSLAVIRTWRNSGIGKRVMQECETIVRDAGATAVFLDCVDVGFLPSYYADLGYEALHQKEITYPSGNSFPMVLVRKQV